MKYFEPNSYSERWFESFHIGIGDARTISEVDFVCSFAPLPQFRAINDVCCGMGRHARELSKRGYTVTGVDRNARMIAKARELGGGPRYIQADLREYKPEKDAYDAVIVMGQSFGYFDSTTNRLVLRRLGEGVKEKGRLILDLWNPEFFVSHQGEHDFDLPDGTVHETKRIENDRLYVRLTYANGDREDFDWQLFTPAEIKAMATSLALIASCADFDCSVAACSSRPKIQFVMERCS